jgi:hypothetical protein
MLADPVVLWALVVADTLIAAGCLFPGRWNAVSAWAAILLVVAGNFVFLQGIRTDRIPSCGCFGPVKLGVVEHVVLAVCVYFLAARTILPSPTSRRSRRPQARRSSRPSSSSSSSSPPWITGYDNNVYVQIGLIMLIGLAAKNAILIVEFAKAKHDGGTPVEEAALESARLRFRPILMTAFAFILGVVPLMLSNGAGAGAQNVMGTAVFWGMLVATILGVFIIPGNFAFVTGIFGGGKKAKPAETAPPEEPEAHAEH